MSRILSKTDLGNGNTATLNAGTGSARAATATPNKATRRILNRIAEAIRTSNLADATIAARELRADQQPTRATRRSISALQAAVARGDAAQVRQALANIPGYTTPQSQARTNSRTTNNSRANSGSQTPAASATANRLNQANRTGIEETRVEAVAMILMLNATRDEDTTRFQAADWTRVANSALEGAIAFIRATRTRSQSSSASGQSASRNVQRSR